MDEKLMAMVYSENIYILWITYAHSILEEIKRFADITPKVSKRQNCIGAP